MKSREYIKKILKEETNKISMILRRLNSEDLEREFQESLDIALNIYRDKNPQDLSLAQFRNTVISSTIDGIHADLISTLPNDVQWYDNVFYALRSLFDERIEENFNELKEKKELPNFLKRRFTEDEINFEFEDALEYTNGLFERIYSRQERTLENYISLTIRVLMDNLHTTLSSRIGEDIEWYEMVENILKDYYKDRITKEYKSMYK
jgi:hypothetical protein